MNSPIDVPLQNASREPDSSAVVRAKRPRNWMSPVLAVGLTVILGVLIASGIIPRRVNVQALEAEAPSNTFKAVVEAATPASSTFDLTLPSRVEAAQETPIYSRVSGYVKEIGFDIGAQVRAGDVLAVIETPELDEQVNQVKATVAQTTADLQLAQTSFERWTKLQKGNVVAAQEVDERKAALDARKADNESARSNLDRLQRLQSFQRIIAPFDGTVTKRLIEVGELVTADTNDASRKLFELANTATLRAFVDVPQTYFRLVTVGQSANLVFREFPGRAFPATVVRTAGALDDLTRTLRTELHVPNDKADLLPGLYTEVILHVLRERPPIAIPAKALVIGPNGVQVATTDEHNRVTLRKVTIDRDLGDTVEIIAGLEPGEKFITNPSDRLADGTVVEIEEPERTTKK